MTRIILCNCLSSQTPDPDAIARGGGGGITCSRVYSHLCGAEAEDARREITAKASSSGAVIACMQERARFLQMAEDIGVAPPGFVDIRDRAGWSDEGQEAGPKMAVLAADALTPRSPVKTFDITSAGTCLIFGVEEPAFTAAERLCAQLAVTVLVRPGGSAPTDRRFEVVSGRLRSATGTLGAFEVVIDALAMLIPGGRGDFGFGAPRDGARSSCDIIIDLSGKPALFPAPGKRDGYIRADPGSPVEVERACFTAAGMTGTFEKPLYLSMNPSVCAHSRAGKPACSKCLDVCPTGAITPAGDQVEVDAAICAGCGACAALCPSGAIAFDNPPSEALFARISRMGEVWRRAAGGRQPPRLLVHDSAWGSELIRLAARFDRGLPADVIPLEVENVSGFGHAEILAALASGFGAVGILAGPKTERTALEKEVVLARALAGEVFDLQIVDPDTPEQLAPRLYARPAMPAMAEPVLPLGDRRQVTRLAIQALRAEEQPINLPEGAPYGTVEVDSDACTLCLACASLCPPGALGDNPDRPQLLFQESACIQCGLCVNICPESAIRLRPRFDASPAALSQRVLNEEEPFCCTECGKPFGVKSTVERIMKQLEGKHSMFATSSASRMIGMCDDCRVKASFHQQNSPLAGPARPPVRTTEDYLEPRQEDGAHTATPAGPARH